MLRAATRRLAVDALRGEVPPGNEKEAIIAAAEATLRQARSGELRSVSCDFHQGVLTLRGEVPSYYLKQVAQELLRTTVPGEQVSNQLRVV